MLPEINTAMREWLDLSDQMGMRADFTRLIEHRVQTFKSDLIAAGLQRMLDMAYRLKEADTRWRAAHREISAKLPPDD
jgi:hypothetical protein